MQGSENQVQDCVERPFVSVWPSIPLSWTGPRWQCADLRRSTQGAPTDLAQAAMASVADLEQQAADTRAAGGDGALLSGILCDLADLKMGKVRRRCEGRSRGHSRSSPRGIARASRRNQSRAGNELERRQLHAQQASGRVEAHSPHSPLGVSAGAAVNHPSAAGGGGGGAGAAAGGLPAAQGRH